MEKDIEPKTALGNGNQIFLCQNHQNDNALTLKADCRNGRNLGWICRAHAVLDLTDRAYYGRYLIQEILRLGGDFVHGPRFQARTSTHCMAGRNYAGGIQFNSINETVRYLKQYFTVTACPSNELQNQAWIDNL